LVDLFEFKREDSVWFKDSVSKCSRSQHSNSFSWPTFLSRKEWS